MKKRKLEDIPGFIPSNDTWKTESDCFKSVKNLTIALETAIRIRKAVIGAGEQDRMNKIVEALLTTVEKQIIFGEVFPHAEKRK